ncbi:MAG: electron transport complex subunit RsxG [Rubrimonas sp.]
MTECAPSAPAPGLSARARLERLRRTPVGHGAVLGLFSCVTALLLATADDLTRAEIARRAVEDRDASLMQVIPPALHDNEPGAAIRRLDDSEEGAVAVHVAALGETVTAVAFELVGDGYAGPIRVLIGLDAAGTVLGVRVLAHAETPGLGDKIEAAKSDWIEGFSGRALGDPALAGWRVRRDGGEFDQFAGATITPRAVVGAVRRALTLFARHRAALIAPPPPRPAVEGETG